MAFRLCYKVTVEKILCCEFGEKVLCCEFREKFICCTFVSFVKTNQWRRSAVELQLMRSLSDNASFVRRLYITKQLLVYGEGILLERCELELRTRQLQLLILYGLQKWNIIPLPGEGGRLLQALFPSIIFALMMAMALAAAIVLTTMTIPLSCHPHCRIRAVPPSEQRRRSFNAVWCVSKSIMAPKVWGSAIIATATQRRRYRRILVLQSTLSPRTWRVSNSNKYTNIQSYYIGNLDKIKLLEAPISAYNMRDPFLSPHW